MWQTTTAWLAGSAVRLVWKFLENLARSRADDPRLATFIKEQIVIYQAGSPLGGKDKLFAAAEAILERLAAPCCNLTEKRHKKGEC